MNSLSIFGTSSDAGKSTLSFAITYLLHKRGIKVAPFKAQNVSNNSQVTDEGGEIAIPQYFAAEAIGLRTSPNMNPILLKSGGKSKAHMIVNGKSVANKDVWEYYRDIKSLQPHVKKAFKTLQKGYDCIVAEGAGSPVELNLMDKDLSNIYVADEFNTKIILVADIQRGGVFASIYGVYNLLPKKLRRNVIGVIVNKFQGDMTLFNEGVVNPLVDGVASRHHHARKQHSFADFQTANIFIADRKSECFHDFSLRLFVNHFAALDRHLAAAVSPAHICNRYKK